MVIRVNAEVHESKPLAADITQALEERLTSFERSAPGTPGVVMRVDSPAGSWSGAVGVEDVRTGAPLRSESGFRTASLTKTFTACTALRLMEEGSLGLDASVAGLLPAGVRDLLDRRLGARFAAGLTLRALLQHTAGLPDHATDAGCRAVLDSDPDRRWSAVGLVQLAMRAPPVSPPGVFGYSDTGYVLVALLIERLAGMPLFRAYADLLDFAGLGLHSTYHELHEQAPRTSAVRARQYLAGVDSYHSKLHWDSYGSGGLISTTADLVSFLRALFNHRVLRPESLEQMLSAPVPTRGGSSERAGLGIFETTVNGYLRYGHEGFWGAWMHHYPELSLTVCGSVTGVPVAVDDLAALHAAPLWELTR